MSIAMPAMHDSYFPPVSFQSSTSGSSSPSPGSTYVSRFAYCLGTPSSSGSGGYTSVNGSNNSNGGSRQASSQLRTQTSGSVNLNLNKPLPHPNPHVNIDDIVYRYSAESERDPDPFRYIAPDPEVISLRKQQYQNQYQNQYLQQQSQSQSQSQSQPEADYKYPQQWHQPDNQPQYQSQYQHSHQQQDYTDHETGTPTVGIYAQDGLWDDESDGYTARPTTGGSSVTRTSATASASGSGSGKSPAASSRGARSRSGTVSIAPSLSASGRKSTRSPEEVVPVPVVSDNQVLRKEVEAKEKEKEKSRMWGWKRPSMANLHAHSQAQVSGQEDEGGESKLAKKQSKSRLRGKGRKSDVAPGDESFESPPPLPDTPSSFLNSPAMSTYLSPPLPHPAEFPSPLATTSVTTTTKAKQGSGWKKGIMTKIFRSKSTNTLRENYHQTHTEDVPPLPDFKSATLHSNTKPSKHTSSSTYTPPPPLPLGERRINTNANTTRSPSQRFSGWMSLNSPASSTSTPDIAFIPSHPSLPLDPFASSLDLSSNSLPKSSSLSISSKLGSPLQPLPQPSRPRLPRHSPSLKDLKNLLPGGGKLSGLGKAKSLANLRIDENRSSPPPPAPAPAQSSKRLSKRISLAPPLRGLAPKPNNPISPVEAAAPPTFVLPPIESPPLLPPNPPYFPPTTSLNRSSRPPALNDATTQSLSSSVSSPITPPPTSPLPPTPLTGSSSSHQLGVVPLNSDSSSRAPLSRSGSGAVLLPRSRSTSMSLKAPPTSSSFFDLYEQLGIWPTPEKTPEEKENAGEEEPVRSDTPLLTTKKEEPADRNSTSGKEQSTEVVGGTKSATLAESHPINQALNVISESPSATFSTSSWEAAINAFPLVEEVTDRPVTSSQFADSSMDFGLPYVEDSMVSTILQASPEMMDDAELAPESGADMDLGPVLSTSSSAPSDPINTCTNVSSSSSYHTARHESSSASGHAGATYSQSQAQNHVRGLGISNANRSSRRETGGTGSGSRDSSRSRRSRRSGKEGDWFEQGESSSSEEDDDEEEAEEGEEDDVPLSQLHPQAQAHREERARVKARKRLEKASKLDRRVTVPTGLGINASAGAKAKVQGRNPGGGEDWDGEGGIPAAVLMRKLDRLSLDIQRRAAAVQQTQTQAHSWSVHSVASGSHTRSATLPIQMENKERPIMRTQRSFAGSATVPPSSDDMPLAGLKRSSTGKRPGSARGGDGMLPPPMPRSSVLTPALPSGSLQPSPAIRPGSSMPSPSLDQHPSSAAMRTNRGSGGTYTSASASRSSHTHTQGSPGQTHAHAMSRATTSSSSHKTTQQADLSRASTIKSVRSTHSHSAPRSRETSDPAVVPTQPPIRERVTKVRAVVEGAGRTLEFDVYAETNARELISRAHASGDLGDVGQSSSWVLYEVFGELACDRQIREYETILSVLKGWDASCRSNALVLRATNRGLQTFARAIPTTAPMLGGFVQYETKKGKWSKRWLETRGGQIFLAKNEKNKDEVQINASFIDVYTMSGAYKAPNPFVFLLKRMDPAVAFENPADYVHVFAAEEGVGYKLLCAIYDAKSFTLAATQPHLLAQLPTRTQSQSRSSVTGPSASAASSVTARHQHPHQLQQHQHQQQLKDGPLVNIGELGEKSAFTGKGLLKV